MKLGVREKQGIERRQQKIDDLRQEGIDPYPAVFRNRKMINELSDFRGFAIRVAGRVVGKRGYGRLAFFDIEDSSGRVQVVWNESVEFKSDNEWVHYKKIALGDMIGVTLRPDQDKYLVLSIVILSKAMREPPLSVFGLSDDEFRFRHREIEMISDKDTRDLFILRSRVINECRAFLIDRGYIEVETPVLQPVYGGATARPFVTHHNALDKTLYLRISSELYLKRYLVGGMDKVFHIGKCFRNEGISPEHSPEFMMLEFFATCCDESDMACEVTDLIHVLCDKYGNNDVLQTLRFDNEMKSSDWPLSRKNPEDPARSLAWELFSGDMEISSGANDLNDPREQSERLMEGSAVVVDDFNEANPYDETYITSLEYGCLPVAGVGVGIDRLMMMLTGRKSIREVTAFPLLK